MMHRFKHIPPFQTPYNQRSVFAVIWTRRYSFQMTHPFSRYTPVTQDGDLAAICKISQIVAGRLWVFVRSHRAPWQRCGSQWGLQGRRGRRQVLNMLKTSAVTSPRKQVAIESRLMRRGVAVGAPGAPRHLSDVVQGAHSIAVGSPSEYAKKHRRYCPGTNKLKFIIPLNKWPHSNYDMWCISVKTLGKI